MNFSSKNIRRKEMKRKDILTERWTKPNWDEYFMFMAITCATRHSCFKRGVGAILVKDKRIIGSGYNGAASGIPSCHELGYCYYENLAHKEHKTNGGDLAAVKENFKIYCQAVHAEANTLTQCSRDKAKGGILYITNYPCPRCTQDIIITNKLSGIRVWKDYLQNSTLTIDERRASENKLLEAGISVQFINLIPERISQIAVYMAESVGARTNYKFRGGE
ncbi:MAG: deaminase [Patescibacteria group bacterium]|nr:deaminase [Patescibacteria group bacterium]